MLGRDARPRRELVAGQPQRQHQLPAQSLADGRENLSGQAQPVGAVLIAAHVAQPGVELPQQSEGPGVQLHAGQPRPPRGSRGSRESADHGIDLGLLHFGRQLSARRVGEAGRRPQNGLRERRGALSAGVPEPGQHKSSVRLACAGDRGPAGLALGGQRRPLVRPIVGGDGCGFGDENADATLGAAGVIGDVPVTYRPAAPQVGRVGAEDHARRCRPAGQRHRLGQQWHAAASVVSPGMPVVPCSLVSGDWTA